MFGVTLKLKYPFYAAIIGSAAGSAYLAATKTLAQALGAAGLPGFISMKPDHYLNFAIGLVLSMAVSFLLTVFFWKKYHLEEAEAGTGKKEKNGAGAAAENMAAEKNTAAEAKKETPAVTGTSEELFFAPAAGKVMPVTKSADEAFAAKAMGDGYTLS